MSDGQIVHFSMGSASAVTPQFLQTQIIIKANNIKPLVKVIHMRAIDKI
jgi:hypothetical protein